MSIRQDVITRMGQMTAMARLFGVAAVLAVTLVLSSPSAPAQAMVDSDVYGSEATVHYSEVEQVASYGDRGNANAGNSGGAYGGGSSGGAYGGGGHYFNFLKPFQYAFKAVGYALKVPYYALKATAYVVHIPAQLLSHKDGYSDAGQNAGPPPAPRSYSRPHDPAIR